MKLLSKRRLLVSMSCESPYFFDSNCSNHYCTYILLNIGDKLYRNFKVYFDNLSPSKKEGVYDAPKAFSLPEPPQAVSSFKQFLVQVRRNTLLTWRNRDSRMVDFTITIIAVLVLNVVMGVSPDLLGQSPTFYWPLFIASTQEASSILQLVFQGAIQWGSQIQIYTLAVGLVVSILIGLNAVSCSYYCCLLCIPTLLKRILCTG